MLFTCRSLHLKRDVPGNVCMSCVALLKSALSVTFCLDLVSEC